MDLISSVVGSSSALDTLSNNFVHALSVLVTASTLVVPPWPPNASVNDGDRFDFIIVGAGSGGATLAGRLTENPDCKVLLIEAGGDPPIFSVVPAGFIYFLRGPTDNWNYYTTNDNVTAQGQRMKGQIYQPRGQMLGGSSSLNYMYYVRGNPDDFNGWARAGHEGWDWESVFPYFLKAEGMLEQYILDDPEYSPYHNSSGPLLVSQAKYSNVIEEKLDVYLDSFDELGVKKFTDYNAESQFGITRSFYTHSKPAAKRSSTAQVYLVPAADRENLFVLKNAIAKKIIITDKKAEGVEVLVNGQTINVYADKEVIASGGVFNTPKLLLASGIGRKTDLENLNIETVAELPVGDYLVDHPVVPIFLTGKSDLATIIKTAVLSYNADTLPLPNLTGFFNIRNMTSVRPEFQLLPMYFGAASLSLPFGCVQVFGYETSACLKLFSENVNKELFFVYLILLHQKSRGRLEFTSVEPEVAPKIFSNFLSDSDDLELYKEGFKYIQGMTSTSYFKAANSEVVDMNFTECADLTFMSEEYLECYIRTSINTLYHPVGTCAMGKVVDSKLKVYNVENLRVVDSSVFPNDITSGNTNAPTIMIAEKIADEIKSLYY